MELLAAYLMAPLQRPVLDATGFGGELEWVRTYLCETRLRQVSWDQIISMRRHPGATHPGESQAQFRCEVFNQTNPPQFAVRQRVITGQGAFQMIS
jgi:hypothetical protein